MKKATALILMLSAPTILSAGTTYHTLTPMNPVASVPLVLAASTLDDGLVLETPEQIAVHQTIEDLIGAGTTFDTDALDRIYHDSMSVMMIDLDGTLTEASKAGFVGLFQSMKDAGKPPLNTKARYHLVRVNGDTANVIVSRNVNLTGADQVLILSIDMTFEDGRWQVVRETIFARPDTDA